MIIFIIITIIYKYNYSNSLSDNNFEVAVRVYAKGASSSIRWLCLLSCLRNSAEGNSLLIRSPTQMTTVS